MKIITIFQDGGKNVVIQDDDDSNLREYSKSISSLLEFSNISILHTSSSSTILRPNKILSININEQKNISEKPFAEDEVEDEEPIDIITDGDLG